MCTFKTLRQKTGVMTVTFTSQLFCLGDTAVHMIALHLYVSNQNIFIIIRTEWMQNS